jgi:hypothetical protein
MGLNNLHEHGLIDFGVLCVDDIIITGDDGIEMSQLKQRLGKEFEVKDLGQLRF